MNAVITGCIVVFALVIGFSAWHGYRKTRESADFFVAGRSAPWWLISGSLIASTVSGATFFGLISSYYRTGFSVHWIPLGVAFSWLVICFAVGPRLRRHGRFTIPEYLADRFNSPGLRVVFSAITVLWMVFLLATVLVQGGLLFGSLWGWSYGTSVVVITVVVILYTFFGGQKAVLYTDFVQAAAFLLAVAVVVPLTISAAGGWGEITATVEAEQPGFFGITGGALSVVNVMALFFVWFLGYLGHPGFLTRFYAARSERDVIKTGIAVSAVYLPFWALIGLAGAATRALYPNVADTETVWVRFVLEQTPAIIAGILLAAILGAILSSADTWLLTAASSGTHDLLRKTIRSEWTDSQLLRRTKLLVVLLGLAALPFGLWRPTYITDMMTIAYTVAGASGGVLILFSLYWRRTTRAGAWGGLIFGAVAAVIGRVVVAMGLTPDWFDPVLPTLLGTVVIVVVVSLVTPTDPVATATFDRLRRPQPATTPSQPEERV
ncbi:MAG: sodium/solute symporter [Streptosporangiales bacterium]|nr:sodium/solute symporter [Streptosporangiales bacterium]